MSSRSEGGLTLLEVLVGLAVAGLVFGTGFPALLSALGARARAEHAATAADLLSDKLAEVRLGAFGAGEAGGAFWSPFERYTWRVSQGPAGPRLAVVRVSVAWEDRGVTRAAEAVTYRAQE